MLAIALTVILMLGYALRDRAFLALIHPGDSATLTGERGEMPASAEQAWLRRPETRPAGAWETPWGVDIFFVHPTTAIWPQGKWTRDDSRIENDPHLERSIDLFADGLAGGYPLYAPAYRQAVLQAMVEFGPDAESALELAYSDVLAAFDSYIESDNSQRAIILVGVEQGALHTARLLTDRFAEGALHDRLGAAYLLEWPIDDKELPVPVCSTNTQTGCAVGWMLEAQAKAASLRKRPSLVAGQYASFGDGKPMCVNPISWRGDWALAAFTDHLGGVSRFDKQGQPIVIAGAVSAQCTDGGLDVDATASDLKQSSWWGWGNSLRPTDINLFYVDISMNVANRARAISASLDAGGRKPAKPFPPVRPLEQAPIHRPDGIATQVR